ncbi:flagellar motor protein MotA [Duganella sp. FT80W]|uniref:Flagellar motor protein MotA n=1 Tax=Duganella guangzhouensis TaxID=2666084 RepID=A0A6I2KWG8_9BURK|nr:MotA/TolQ/ExbB proton channel family protein [Duganella guangzhouensis]MRW90475.1 flagellar motor protein MotA [Duganella guangzhouensis]
MSATAHLTPLELFEQADVIVKSILVLLTIASLVSWGVIIDKLVRFARLRRNAVHWTAALAGQRSLAKLTQQLKQHAQDPFARIYHAIVDEWHVTHRLHLHTSDSGRDSLKERINRVGQIASNVEVEQLQRGLSILATVGSVAPFVGLFGTVWGIMNAFQGIAASNNTSLAVVAPGIAEALFATALGLVAAIPAVVAYNRASGDLNNYAGRLSTLVGLVEVQLSRQLEAGESQLEDVVTTNAAPAHAERAGHNVTSLSTQGA